MFQETDAFCTVQDPETVKYSNAAGMRQEIVAHPSVFYSCLSGSVLRLIGITLE